MKKQTFVYIILGSGVVLVLYLFNQNKKLTEKSEDFFCDRNTHFYDPIKKTRVSLDEAIENGLFDKQCGMYIDPITGKKLNLNEAFKSGILNAEETRENKPSVLLIDIDKNKQSFSLNDEQVKKDILLYEVREVDEKKYVDSFTRK